MKKLAVIVMMGLSFNGLAQNGWAVADQRINISSEKPTGIISGRIKTTDGKPAAYVTVYIKENSKTAITDEQGVFVVARTGT